MFSKQNCRAEVPEREREREREQRERRKQCWIHTKEEIEEGLVGKPQSRARLDKKYGRGKWRCLRTEWRWIDNGKRAKHNEATTMRERITCVTAPTSR
jgi:hypothetical protein